MPLSNSQTTRKSDMYLGTTNIFGYLCVDGQHENILIHNLSFLGRRTFVFSHKVSFVSFYDILKNIWVNEVKSECDDWAVPSLQAMHCIAAGAAPTTDQMKKNMSSWNLHDKKMKIVHNIDRWQIERKDPRYNYMTVIARNRFQKLYKPRIASFNLKAH